MVQVGFWINDPPPKEGVFTNIGKNFAETLQFEDLAVKNFFQFFYALIFVKKILNKYQKHFFMNGEKKFKTLCEKKFQCV